MNEPSIRFKSIDFIKGVTILSVINMHVCAWSGTLYLSDIYRGMASLWNIPVFFFIAGFFSAEKYDVDDSFRYVARQSAKVLRDLFIVITFCVVCTTTYFVIMSHGVLFSHEYIQSILSAYLFRTGGILLAPWRVLPGSYWFIVVYFKLLILTVPAYYLIRKNVINQPAAIIAVCFWFLVLMIDRLLLFYLPLFWLGFIYKTKPGILSPRIALILSLTLLIALGIWISTIKTIPSFSITSLNYLTVALQPILILTILLGLERKGSIACPGLLSKFLQWAGRNSLKIYLWEAVFTSLPYYYVPYLRDSMQPFSLYLITLVMCTILTLITTRLHEIALSKYSILISLERIS